MADNNSSDGSVYFTKKRFPKVKILALNKNYGYAGANNAASKIARGSFLVLLNNDARLDLDYISELTKFIKANPNTKIVATKEYSYDGKDFISQ